MEIQFQNRNDYLGESALYESIKEMVCQIREGGYEFPEDGLIEGRDYDRVYFDEQGKKHILEKLKNMQEFARG